MQHRNHEYNSYYFVSLFCTFCLYYYDKCNVILLVLGNVQFLKGTNTQHFGQTGQKISN